MKEEKKERKISFHTLLSRQWKTHTESPYTEIEDIIKFVVKLKKLEKKYELKESKFCLLQSASIENISKEEKIITGFFKSARDSFRPNLIDRHTGEERKSPKKISEGDIEKTHFCIKITEEEVFLIIEVNGNGISINQIVDYFGYFTKQYYKVKGESKNFSLDYMKMGKDDFLKEIKKLKRARIAEIYFNKSLLGSSALNFSNRTTSLKRDLVLTATAERQQSITEVAIDAFNVFSTDGENTISKVRVYGKDDNNTNVILDTSFIEKIEQLNSSLNHETGEIVTSEILTSLKVLIKTL